MITNRYALSIGQSAPLLFDAIMKLDPEDDLETINDLTEYLVIKSQEYSSNGDRLTASMLEGIIDYINLKHPIKEILL